MNDKEKAKSKAPKIFGLIIAILIFIYLAMVIPGLPGYRAKGFCARAEADAQNIAGAISDYFKDSQHLKITRNDVDKLLVPDNPWTMTQCGENFYIHVIDRTGKCPAEYQNADAGWNANIYTLKF